MLAGLDLRSTLVNLLLPPGTILTTDASTSSEFVRTARVRDESVMPHDDEASSLNGLGGYHGSVHVGGDAGASIYYAVGVYSEALPDGSQNGIPVFNENWKNVVATFYHELNEARTDPDVEDTIRTGDTRFSDGRPTPARSAEIFPWMRRVTAAICRWFSRRCR